MRKIYLLVMVLFATIIVAAPAMAAPPIPKELTDEQVTQVEQNCRQAQVSLRNLQKRDTVLRINRGRIYDMTLRQTEAFVKRLETHKIEAPAVKQADTDIRSGFQRFRANYDKYAENLNVALSTNCTAKPKEFYQALHQTAEERQQVAKEVAAIKKHFGDYQTALSQLRKQKFPTGATQ